MFCSSPTAETNCFTHLLLQYYRPVSRHTSLTHLCNELFMHLWPLLHQEVKYGTVENVSRLQRVDGINPRDGNCSLRGCVHLCVYYKTVNIQWRQLMVSLLAVLLGLHDVQGLVTLTATASCCKLNLSLVHPVKKRQRGDTMQFIWLTNIGWTPWAPEGMLLSPQLTAPVKTQNLLPDWA